jgi:beta-1,4-mannosyltransferase
MFEGTRPKRACIIVLGDIGRSPRMQYHSKSFAENNFLVDFVGYLENPPIQDVLDNPKINIHQMYEFPEFYLPRILKYLFKVLWQILSLMNVFLRLKKPDYVGEILHHHYKLFNILILYRFLSVCQNPPGVPTLFMCYFYCKIIHAKLVIDWHNYTHTNLALTSSPTSKIVRIAKYIESTFGRKSDLNFCVTEAMKDDLKLCWNIK